VNACGESNRRDSRRDGNQFFMSESLIIMPLEKLPVAQIAPIAIHLRDEALASSALIGKVENAEQNNKCSAARKQIKGLLSLFESQRKKLKEPILEAGRYLDRIVATESEDLKREDGRLENLEKDFIRAELRRKSEEEELQRKELARIEAEKQAELLRIAREQAAREEEARRVAAEAERIASEEREAAEKLAREATNKKQREAAEAARIEAEKRAEAARIEAERIAELAAETARQQAQLAVERAETATYVESRPVEITRAKGQSVRKEWVIEQINDFQLMKARPDLVRKVEWDMVGLKQALAAGEKLPGVRAREDISIGTRAGKALIEV